MFVPKGHKFYRPKIHLGHILNISKRVLFSTLKKYRLSQILSEISRIIDDFTHLICSKLHLKLKIGLTVYENLYKSMCHLCSFFLNSYKSKVFLTIKAKGYFMQINYNFKHYILKYMPSLGINSKKVIILYI